MKAWRAGWGGEAVDRGAEDRGQRKWYMEEQRARVGLTAERQKRTEDRGVSDRGVEGRWRGQERKSDLRWDQER